MLRYFLFLLLPLFAIGQTNKEYQGLLWKISGNDLEEPSYLYGTMHVSNRVAFHLSETFFDALENADIIALETNPQHWVKDLTTSELYHDFFSASYSYSTGRYPLYSSFVPKEPQQQELEYYLSRDQDILNSLLYRNNSFDQDFEENTYLDLFIFQAGKKKGKKIVALEDYQGSFKSVLMAGRHDKDAVKITDRQAKALLGDFNDWNDLLEDAYRKGNLDLLDTITGSLNPGKYHRQYMLDVRNLIMVNGMDSLMKHGILFTGVGAAHLPGKKGVINLLRERGYTVEAEEREISSASIDQKEIIDEIIYTQPVLDFISDDHFIETKAPGKLVKFLSQPYQEYVYADMANGSFYSIRRIPTYGKVYGKNENAYLAKVDSLLFENIPGKIISKKEVSVSGFPAFDISNKTKQGDFQHYQIVCTPLEIIIFKVGGHKNFAKSAQPQIFFKNIKLNIKQEAVAYTPQFGGFTGKLPGNLRIEQYEAAFYNPSYTFWTQSVDDDGDYYALGLRQYHDFGYLEEDDFELSYFAKKISEEKKLELDTVYLIEKNGRNYAHFELSNKKEQKLFGEVHLEGAKYAVLLTNTSVSEKRKPFFEAFKFDAWNYANEFSEYQDSVFHITLKSPEDINNFDSFFRRLRGSSYSYNDENHDFSGTSNFKLITYEPTGEQIRIRSSVLHKYSSDESLDEFWDGLKEDWSFDLLKTLKDTILYTKKEENYLSQAREYWLTDTNTDRLVKFKIILENGALYSLHATMDAKAPTSRFVEEALLSFRTTGDTIIGLPVTTSKANLFFDALQSGDSVALFEAKNSISAIKFEDSDIPRIKDIITNFKHPDFKRVSRLSLINKLAWLDAEQSVIFLEDLYYQNLDSSAYQFKILETLADLETKKGNKSFLKLILDEPPFTSEDYSYNNLINELTDSLELAPALFPGILELTDFEDYRSSIYSLLGTALDSGLLNGSDYKGKYSTILRFAKVELKKQRASEQRQRSNYDYSPSYNSDLTLYNKLLTPFSKKKEVQEHYANLLKINNEQILVNQLEIIATYYSIPDTIWNYVCSDPAGHLVAYDYLKSMKQLQKLDSKFTMKQRLAESMISNSGYGYNRTKYDSIQFIRSEKIDIKPFPAEVFFFQAQEKDEKLWSFHYVVLEDKADVNIEPVTSDKGEDFNPDLDDIEEIIEDALKEIEIYERRRAVSSNNYNF